MVRGGHNGQGVMVRRDMEVTGCRGGHNGQGAMVRRDVEVTEIVEDTMDRVSW